MTAPAPDTPESLKSLTKRLEEAERESVRVRRFGLVLMACGAAIVGLMAALILVGYPRGMGVFTPTEVQARRFVIRDAWGRTRGLVGMSEDGASQILLSDTAGRPRLRLRVYGDGSSGVSLVDGANQPRLVLGVLPDQSTTMVLAESGKTRAVFGLTPTGAATMLFADRKGVTKAGLGVDQHGLGTLTLVDRVGGRVLSLPNYIEGKNVEGGGELIGTNHPTWVAYKQKFNLDFLDVTSEDDLDAPMVIDGDQRSATGAEMPALRLNTASSSICW